MNKKAIGKIERALDRYDIKNEDIYFDNRNFGEWYECQCCLSTVEIHNNAEPECDHCNSKLLVRKEDKK